MQARRVLPVNPNSCTAAALSATPRTALRETSCLQSVPGGQTVQSDADVAFLLEPNVPATHSVQLDDPGAAQAPAEQHTAAPAPLPFVAAQETHAADDVAAADALKRPGGQEMHAESWYCSGAALNVPAGQGNGAPAPSGQ